MAFSKHRISFIATLSFMGLVSIVTIALKGETLSFISINTNDSVGLTPQAGEHIQLLAALPLHMYTAGSGLAIASGAISLALAIIGVALTIWFWPNARRTYCIPPHYLWPIILFFNALLSAITAIYFFKTNERSAHFDPQHISQTVWYDQGRYDIETWTCELQAYPGGSNVIEDFSRQCKIEKAGRLMLLTLGFVALVTASVGQWAIAKDRYLVRRRDSSWNNLEECFELTIAKKDTDSSI